MKIKIDFYIVKLVRDNITYFIVLFMAILGLVMFTVFFINRNEAYKSETSTLETEIDDLKNKANLIDYKEKIIQDDLDIDQINSIVSTLVPDSEDYFSVIVALDEISKKTNFIITNYVINLQGSTKNKLALTISGSGDQESFLNFLKEYNYIGGRLITIDRINFNERSFAKMELGINFYSGKGSSAAQKNLELATKDKEYIRKLQEKVQVNMKSDNEIESDTSYSLKENPF